MFRLLAHADPTEAPEQGAGARWDRDAVELHPAGGRLGRRAVRAAFLFPLAPGRPTPPRKAAGGEFHYEGSTIRDPWLRGDAPDRQLVTGTPGTQKKRTFP